MERSSWLWRSRTDITFGAPPEGAACIWPSDRRARRAGVAADEIDYITDVPRLCNDRAEDAGCSHIRHSIPVQLAKGWPYQAGRCRDHRATSRRCAWNIPGSRALSTRALDPSLRPTCSCGTAPAARRRTSLLAEQLQPGWDTGMTKSHRRMVVIRAGNSYFRAAREVRFGDGGGGGGGVCALPDFPPDAVMLHPTSGGVRGERALGVGAAQQPTTRALRADESHGVAQRSDGETLLSLRGVWLARSAKCPPTRFHNSGTTRGRLVDHRSGSAGVLRYAVTTFPCRRLVEAAARMRRANAGGSSSRTMFLPQPYAVRPSGHSPSRCCCAGAAPGTLAAGSRSRGPEPRIARLFPAVRGDACIQSGG